MVEQPNHFRISTLNGRVMCKQIAIVLLFIMTTVQCSFGQSKNHIFLGPTAGAMYYLGDLKSNALPQGSTLRGFFGLETKLKHLNKASVKLGYQRGTLFGADSLSRPENGRNFHFRSRISDFYLLGKYNLINHRKMARKRYQFLMTPGIVGGFNVFHFNPKVIYQGEWISARDLGTEGQNVSGQGYPDPYNLWQFGLKFGVEINLRFSDKIEVDLFTHYTKTFTDYLDDVSGEYPDFEDLVGAPNGDIAVNYSYRYDDGGVPARGVARGNPDSQDGFINTGFALYYRLTRIEKKRFNSRHVRRSRKPRYF